MEIDNEHPGKHIKAMEALLEAVSKKLLTLVARVQVFD